MELQVLVLRRKLAFMQGPTARATPSPAAAPVDADDVIRRAIFKRLESEPWRDASTSNVFVDHGKVVYQGLISHAASRRAARQSIVDRRLYIAVVVHDSSGRAPDRSAEYIVADATQVDDAVRVGMDIGRSLIGRTGDV